jgi:phosphatidate phosphatase PAH1
VVIRHKNQTLRSTPFQSVFAEKCLKRDAKKNKLKDLQLFVNEELIDVPMRIDNNNGRVQFQKVQLT